MQVVYLSSYNYFDTIIVYLSLLHFMSFLIAVLCMFIMMVRSGSGLILVPHQLNNGQIQYEGFTKEDKPRHLFTFKLNLGRNFDQATAVRSDSITDSEDSENFDRTSRDFPSTYLESLVDVDRLTEYDATERLL